jgi:Outer membrane lipoprotein-sorting protein
MNADKHRSEAHCSSVFIRVYRWLIMLALLAPPVFGQQQKALTIQDLLARVLARRDATDFRASGRLVRVAASGERRTYQISMKARAFGDVLKIFCEVTDPPPARVRLLLESRRSGRSTVRTGHNGDRAPRELPAENWGDALLDTDFSYEDLMETHFLWHGQTLVSQTQYGARACDLVRSEPGPADRSHYASVTSWLDKDVYYPVRVEKTLKGSGGVKEFIYYGLRESKGIWSASQIECKMRGRQGSTLLIISRGSEKAHVAPGDFDPALLTR